MNPITLFFSAEGRIPRSTWWIGAVMLGVIGLIGIYLLLRMFGPDLFLTFRGRACSFAFNTCLLFMGYNLAAKRFQDRSRSIVYPRIVLCLALTKLLLDLFRVTGDPWALNFIDVFFLIFILGVLIWYVAELGCLRGTAGPNRHGPDPLAAS